MNRKTMLLLVGVALLAGIVSSVGTLFIFSGAGNAYATPEGNDQDSIKTKQLIILDKNNAVKAVISTGKDTLPCIALVDNAGKVRISLALTGDGSPAIGLADSEERSRIGFAVTKENDAAFTIMDAKGDVKAAIGVEKEKGLILINGNRKEE